MKAWFVTGGSRGLGYEIAEAALERGDQVAAAARYIDPLAPLADRYGAALLPLRLDVTDRAAAKAAVDEAHAAFGHLDVVVNNAGYAVIGAVEEASEEDVRAQFETNFFGALWVTQAALPHLRAQGSGHIVQISSVGGVVAFPMVGVYNAAKFALEAISDSLAQEVERLGIRVTLVEPGALRTNWPQDSIARTEPLPDYAEQLAERLEAMAAEFDGNQPGDPRRAAAALLEVVDAPNPPLRLLMGNGAFDVVNDLYRRRLAEWAAWEQTARATDFPAGA